MLSKLKSLFSRDSSKGRPTDDAPATSGWSSLSFDPEMTPFGSAREPSAVVSSEADAQVQSSIAAAAAAKSEPLICIDLVCEGEELTPAPTTQAAPEEHSPEAAAQPAPASGLAVQVAVDELNAPPAAEALPAMPAPRAKKAAAKSKSLNATTKTKPTKKSSPPTVEKKPAAKRAPRPAPTSPGRISAAALTKGPWQMPGMNGWEGAPHNNEVEFNELDGLASN